MLPSLAPETHFFLLVTRSSLGYCRGFQGRFEEAEADLLWSYGNVVDQMGPDHNRAKKIARYLAETYERWGKTEDSNAWRAKAGESG